jgi:2-amino-4-hydroxy-6-hydroxymethyldihydropteridine diphosphokinase
MAEAEGWLDRIHIRDLVLRCIIGINPDEREQRQDVIINITMYADLRQAGLSDNIDDTVNYKTVKQRVVHLVETSSCLLVERLAQEIADICLADPRVQQVDVTLDKPGALRYARSVGLQITRHKHGATRAEADAAVSARRLRAAPPASVAYVGVGSNIEPEANIERALEQLRQSVRVTGTSTFYRTAAIGRPDQADYLNGVWRIEPALSAKELKVSVLRPIEQRLGRVRGSDRYAPRTIDLDVLLCGRQVVHDADCQVPAPEILDRRFLCMGLLELDPDLVLPGMDRPLALLVKRAQEEALEPDWVLTARLREKIHV